jgi:hypothetical protein
LFISVKYFTELIFPGSNPNAIVDKKIIREKRKKVFLLLNISKRFVLKVKINKICAKNIVSGKALAPLMSDMIINRNVKIKDFANETKYKAFLKKALANGKDVTKKIYGRS